MATKKKTNTIKMPGLDLNSDDNGEAYKSNVHRRTMDKKLDAYRKREERKADRKSGAPGHRRRPYPDVAT